MPSMEERSGSIDHATMKFGPKLGKTDNDDRFKYNYDNDIRHYNDISSLVIVISKRALTASTE